MNRHPTISLSSGLYRRYRNSTGSVPVSRESRTVTAGREFHPALRKSSQRYGKELSMQNLLGFLFGFGRIHHDLDEIASRDDVFYGFLHVFCIDVSDGSFVFLVEIDSVFLKVDYVAHPV